MQYAVQSKQVEEKEVVSFQREKTLFRTTKEFLRKMVQKR